MQEYDALLEILGAYLGKRKPVVSEAVDWCKLYQLAQIHSVSGILGYITMQYPLCGDADMRARLRKDCLGTMTFYARRAALARLLLEQLEKAGVRHCTMKGLVVRETYPVPELRSFNDVDLLICSEERVKCHQLMLSLGFEVKDDWEPIYSYLKDNEYYEIHTRLMEVDISDRADYRGYFDRAWEYAERTSEFGYQLRPEFHFLYLLMHIAKHVQGSGAGIRMYLDIAACIKMWGAQLDWAWIFHELNILQLMNFGCTVLSAVESWFGVVCPAEFQRTVPGLLDEFRDFTLEAGTFGHFNRDSGTIALKRQKDGSRLAALCKRAFPKAETIESRYTYLQGRHWLLPVAWIHRVFKTDVSLRDHAKEAKTILTEDETESKRLQRICDEIGL